MVLLNPTILLGLLAASIPIILHFLNLRKIKKVEFSTLSFLKELQKSKIRKIKIKQLLLLLIRILIIIFLVLAFARPTLESTTISGISSSAKTTAVFIVDNSFSMSVVNEKGSFLNQSKTIISDLIATFENKSDIHLITTSEKENNSFVTPQIIDNINISVVTLPFSKSLKKTQQIISESKNLNKEVYIFSDFQKSTFWQNDSLNKIFNFFNTKFYLFRFASESTSNLSATNLKINNQIFEVNKEIGITSETTNFTNQNISNHLNSLYFNGKRVAQKSISVNGNQTKATEFQATPDNAGIIEIETKLEDDAIKHDNSFYNYIIVPNKIKLLLVDKNDELLFVKTAMKLGNKVSMDINSINPNEFNNANLDDYTSIIIAGSVWNNSRSRLKDYISNGGSVILFPEKNGNFSDQNILLNFLNMPSVLNFSESGNLTSINSFGKIDFNHPIFNGIFAKKSEEIESPIFYKYLKFGTNGNGRNVIALQDNSIFLSEYQLNKGKILFFNVSPNMEWSNFPIKNIFAPLINRSVSYLASNISNEEAIFAGSDLSINISKRKSNHIKVELPDGSEEVINIDDENSKYLTYSNTTLLGIYRFYSNNILLDIKAVNFNSAESNLESLPTKLFTEAISGKLNSIINIELTDSYKTQITNSRYGSELWMVFLIAALLVALFEMHISRSSKKDLAEI
ncbi:MAG: hypothetical protein COW71_03285 [Ignavibacteriales bacterium CG18_big_fil_WC_8_21_14_2_50_31_20]|nr:MAG: hypothetical protein COW71_03285 [Ignavibacteriales bacterium CG18_big_fil_WC_8_21_14_2_50_31_20]